MYRIFPGNIGGLLNTILPQMGSQIFPIPIQYPPIGQPVPNTYPQQIYTAPTQPITQSNIQMYKPTSPPPSYKPQKPQSYAPGFSLQPCMRKITYVWFTNGGEGWYFPVMTWGDSVLGFYYNPNRLDWQYQQMDMKIVATLTC